MLWGTRYECLRRYREVRPQLADQFGAGCKKDFDQNPEKYMRGKGDKEEGMKGADRIIPAPLSPELTAKIQDIAKRAFLAIQGQGIARIDFLVKPDLGEVWLNEINTLPGSLSFYLWEKSGKTAAQVVDELIQLGLQRHAEKRQTTFDYRSKLLEHAAKRGLSGVKK